MRTPGCLPVATGKGRFRVLGRRRSWDFGATRSGADFLLPANAEAFLTRGGHFVRRGRFDSGATAGVRNVPLRRTSLLAIPRSPRIVRTRQHSPSAGQLGWSVSTGWLTQLARQQSRIEATNPCDGTSVSMYDRDSPRLQECGEVPRIGLRPSARVSRAGAGEESKSENKAKSYRDLVCTR